MPHPIEELDRESFVHRMPADRQVYWRAQFDSPETHLVGLYADSQGRHREAFMIGPGRKLRTLAEAVAFRPEGLALRHYIRAANCPPGVGLPAASPASGEPVSRSLTEIIGQKIRELETHLAVREVDLRRREDLQTEREHDVARLARENTDRRLRAEEVFSRVTAELERRESELNLLLESVHGIVSGLGASLPENQTLGIHRRNANRRSA